MLQFVNMEPPTYMRDESLKGKLNMRTESRPTSNGPTQSTVKTEAKWHVVHIPADGMHFGTLIDTELEPTDQSNRVELRALVCFWQVKLAT
jgi:hypothetical protein